MIHENKKCVECGKTATKMVPVGIRKHIPYCTPHAEKSMEGKRAIVFSDYLTKTKR